jgi:hypothetical protein
MRDRSDDVNVNGHLPAPSWTPHNLRVWKKSAQAHAQMGMGLNVRGETRARAAVNRSKLEFVPW